ncbi:hypothetical protein [Pseudomonas fluorescens]|uniref:hypothetical protein n=1 Tax=Pseudomonas fluorescens TaxID=294 RepID=UPI0009B5F7F7|nr:hypothetical protein [Pseudomonas fluorescens]
MAPELVADGDLAAAVRFDVLGHELGIQPDEPVLSDSKGIELDRTRRPAGDLALPEPLGLIVYHPWPHERLVDGHFSGPSGQVARLQEMVLHTLDHRCIQLELRFTYIEHPGVHGFLSGDLGAFVFQQVVPHLQVSAIDRLEGVVSHVDGKTVGIREVLFIRKVIAQIRQVGAAVGAFTQQEQLDGVVDLDERIKRNTDVDFLIARVDEVSHGLLDRRCGEAVGYAFEIYKLPFGEWKTAAVAYQVIREHDLGIDQFAHVGNGQLEMVVMREIVDDLGRGRDFDLFAIHGGAEHGQVDDVIKLEARSGGRDYGRNVVVALFIDVELIVESLLNDRRVQPVDADSDDDTGFLAPVFRFIFDLVAHLEGDRQTRVVGVTDALNDVFGDPDQNRVGHRIVDLRLGHGCGLHKGATPVETDDVVHCDVGVRQAAAGLGPDDNRHSRFGNVFVHTAVDDFRGNVHVQVGVTGGRVGVLATGEFQFDEEVEGLVRALFFLIGLFDFVGELVRTGLQMTGCHRQHCGLVEFALIDDGTPVDLTAIEQQLDGVADILFGPGGDQDKHAEVRKGEYRRPVDPPLAGRQEAPGDPRVQQ